MLEPAVGGSLQGIDVPWAEPEQGSFPPYIVPSDPAREPRNLAILAEVARRLEVCNA